MPMLLALGQHRALEASQSRLRDGEILFAFPDDVLSGVHTGASCRCLEDR